MSESIKLTGNKYIDSTGVYDSTSAQLQSTLNSKLSLLTSGGACLKHIANMGSSRTLTITRSVFDQQVFLVLGMNYASTVGLDIMSLNTNGSYHAWVHVAGDALFSSVERDGEQLICTTAGAYTRLVILSSADFVYTTS